MTRQYGANAGSPDATDPAGADRGPHRRRSNGRVRVAALAGAVVLTAVVATACSNGGSGVHTADPSSARSASAAPMAASVPDRIVIPSIGVDAHLNTVGLQPDGQMEEPSFDAPMEAAWYRQGPTPGEAGVSAIVGHLDTPKTSEAVFYKVDTLKKGAEIDVERQDHSTAVFDVDSVDTFLKSEFPTQKVYGGTGGKAELRLITCGGNLTDQRHWDSNVVVFAHLVSKP
ncbi:class F sortase [Streptomyces sp. NPDC098789]|uniref:class F sortase n=1 Tax=Streptomyces sp. NPDC098789 TaxID=3366098 RepID=UPI0038083241